MAMKPWFRNYFALLGSRGRKELEDRIVRTLLSALSEAGAAFKPPIRLSVVASRFQIAPWIRSIVTNGARLPHQELLPLAEGLACFSGSNEEGRLEFDSRLGAFVISLRNTDGPSARARLRFTYAHEVAHRFFFVFDGQSWVRALALAVNALDGSARLRGRLALWKLEEELCNSIARQVLVPQALLQRCGSLQAWLNEGKGLDERLRAVAREFEVSRECLLIQLNSLWKKEDSAGCVLLVKRSSGFPGQIGQRALRVATFAAGSKLGKFFYPGMPLAKLGQPIEEFACNLWHSSSPAAGELTVNLYSNGDLLGTLKGWFHCSNQTDYEDQKVLLIWGTIT